VVILGKKDMGPIPVGPLHITGWMTGVEHPVTKMWKGTHDLLLVRCKDSLVRVILVDEKTKGKPKLPSPALAAREMRRF
jgi:hypothetical protein